MPAVPRVLNARVLRNEDARLLTGRARFVDDVQLPGMLHVAFVRSDYAHARLVSVDVSAASQQSGCGRRTTADDLGSYSRPAPLLVPPPPIRDLVLHARTHLPLAKDKVRFVGEAIAMVMAESRYVAEDALRDVDRRDRSARRRSSTFAAAMQPGAARVHEQLATNVAAHVGAAQGRLRGGESAVPMSSSITRRFRYDRGASAAIENRAVVAQWDPQAEELTIWDTTQAPIPIRSGLAARLGLSQSQVRVVAPFVGGGFGPKIMMFYPEELIAALGGDAAAAAGEVGRGSPGELLRDDAGAGTGPRGGDGTQHAAAGFSAFATPSSSTPAPTIRMG